MFVCICNGHRDSDIRRVAATGVSCARQIYRRLGKPVRCGRCLEFAAGVIAEVQTTSDPAARDEPRGACEVAAAG
jgi:bacterioferritin-associated ferredoxin